MTSDEIEKEIQARCLTAPRVTPADVEAAIVGEFFFRPSEYDLGCGHGIGAFDREKVKRHTICILTLVNGFTVVGVNEGPVSAANFDAELGRKLAREKAVEKIWPLLGYELRTRLAGEGAKPKRYAAEDIANWWASADPLSDRFHVKALMRDGARIETQIQFGPRTPTYAADAKAVEAILAKANGEA